MAFPYFKGDGSRQSDSNSLPPSRRTEFRNPERYRPGTGLVDAVNVALLLGQPLLLTGEPGTGKSELANYVAWELGFEPLLKFETKSDSQSGDLFYTYDALKRFQHAQSGIAEESALQYIRYNALGEAILQSRPREAVENLLPDVFDHHGPTRSVVLIDEIDKAPRDFPNDILNELDQLYFRISELDNLKIEANRDLQPIVIMTSNSEKDLPSAFLRRCIFYDIPFPEPDAMREIVDIRLHDLATDNGAFLDDALSLFYALRAANLRKKPSTSELLEWITAMRDMGGEAENPLADDPAVALRTTSALRKAVGDKDEVDRVVNQWIQSRTQTRA